MGLLATEPPEIPFGSHGRLNQKNSLTIFYAPLKGTLIVRSSCKKTPELSVPCPVGTFFVNNTCVFCPEGTYQVSQLTLRLAS